VTPDLRVRGLFLLPTFGTQFSETRVELFLFWLLSLDRGFETGRATQRGDLDLDQIIKSHDRFSCALLGELGVCIVETTMTTLKALTMTAALLAGGASMATAQNGLPYPGYGYGYGYAAPLYDYAAPGYSYPATAPLYDYAAPRYVAPAPAGLQLRTRILGWLRACRVLVALNSRFTSITLARLIRTVRSLG
jgi:hypothetical protein